MIHPGLFLGKGLCRRSQQRDEISAHKLETRHRYVEVDRGWAPKANHGFHLLQKRSALASPPLILVLLECPRVAVDIQNLGWFERRSLQPVISCEQLATSSSHLITEERTRMKK